MKKHIYLTIMLLSAIGLGLLGCSEEDFFEKNELQEINSIISQFSQEAFTKVIPNDYKVNWNISAPLEHSEELGLDYYEFEISLSENQVPVTNKLYDTKQSLLAIKREGGKYDFYVAKYFMDRWKSEGKSVKDVSLSKMESFSGLLNVFDSGNQMVHAKRMDNGRVLGTPVSLNSDFNNIEARMEEDCETEVTIYHYVESYKPVYNEGYTAILYYEFDFIFLTGISYETTCYANYFPELNLEGGVPGTYYSQNGGGSYAGCNDPNGCVYNVETKLVDSNQILLEKLRPLIDCDPKALLTQTSGAVQNNYSGWADLAQHEVSAVVQAKLNSTSSFDLSLQNAKGPVVNMDNFSVKVTSLPNNMSAMDLFQAFRSDINSYVDTSISLFTPYSSQDVDSWYSNNPVGSMFSIKFYDPVVGWLNIDDGSVITSDYTGGTWIFTTAWTPKDGQHPVSGNREFGFSTNSDGSYTFFTRGVDRTTTQFTATAQYFTNTVFGGGDLLWSSFQQKLASYVNSNGGSANIEMPIKHRVNWEMVNSILLGNEDTPTCN